VYAEKKAVAANSSAIDGNVSAVQRRTRTGEKTGLDPALLEGEVSGIRRIRGRRGATRLHGHSRPDPQGSHPEYDLDLNMPSLRSDGEYLSSSEKADRPLKTEPDSIRPCSYFLT